MENQLKTSSISQFHTLAILQRAGPFFPGLGPKKHVPALGAMMGFKDAWIHPFRLDGLRFDKNPPGIPGVLGRNFWGWMFLNKKKGVGDLQGFFIWVDFASFFWGFQ